MVKVQSDKTTKVKQSRTKQPEQVISRLAKEGKLAVVGAKAMADSFELGLSVTRLEGNNIVEVFPDGTRKILKTIEDNLTAQAS